MDLEDYREEIDRLNREIADAVSRRMSVVQEIGRYKKKHGMEIKNENREEVVRQQFEKCFSDEGLPPEKGRKLADLLIETAVEAERSESVSG